MSDLIKVAIGAEGTKRITITSQGRRWLAGVLHIAAEIKVHDETSQAYEALNQLASHVNPETGWYELPAQPEKPF